jgi:hypothetical protein
LYAHAELCVQFNKLASGVKGRVHKKIKLIISGNIDQQIGSVSKKFVLSKKIGVDYILDLHEVEVFVKIIDTCRLKISNTRQ